MASGTAKTQPSGSGGIRELHCPEKRHPFDNGRRKEVITGKVKEMKQVVRIISQNQHILEMHDPRLGDKFKTMEITYTRQ